MDNELLGAIIYLPGEFMERCNKTGFLEFMYFKDIIKSTMEILNGEKVCICLPSDRDDFGKNLFDIKFVTSGDIRIEQSDKVKKEVNNETK